MINRFFDKYMDSEEGIALLKDIPSDKIPIFREKLFAAFYNGAELGMTLLVINQIGEMPAAEKEIIFDYLLEEIKK